MEDPFMADDDYRVEAASTRFTFFIEQQTIRLWVEVLTDMDLDTAEATQA
jgi:hypothetical protein